MPEGHTIHRAAQQSLLLAGGDVVVASSPQGRFAASAARIDGARLLRVDAWGKHLFTSFDGGELLHVHLGLFGRFATHEQLPPPSPTESVRLRLVGSRAALDLSGPTICRLVDPAGRDGVVARLGPDPLRRDPGGGERFATRVLASRAPIGALLMNQTVVAGVGNVYRAEALFLESLHPERPGRTLSVEATAALWQRLVVLLRDGVRRGAIVTIDPALVERPSGALRRGGATGTRRGRPATWVYGQQHCRRCAAPVRSWELAGRRCYACEVCQPPVGLTG